MKKIVSFALFSLILAATAGFIAIGCTSEPPEGNKIEGGEGVMTFEGGKYEHRFDSPKIVHGNEYEVILTIIDCDDAFVGSYLGGKIIYKIGETEYLLSGWSNAAPLDVKDTTSTREYKWTFKAGEKNADSLEPVNPSTTPEDAIQYFQLTAQDNTWTGFPDSISFNVKGSFNVISRETISEFDPVLTITLGNEDSTAGKGAISEAQMTTIRDTVAAAPRSIIRFTVNIPNVGSGGADIGNGVVVVGDWTSGVPINVPATATNGQAYTFTADLDVSDILVTLQPGHQIAINPHSTATVTSAVLMRPRS